MPAFSTRRATCSISSAVRGCGWRGFLVQEERNRHAPVALARDAPVRAGLHHRFQAGAAPGREELRLIDGALGDPAQGRGVFVLLVFHADEPLRRGAEDDRRLVAPAVRVAVLDFLGFEQSTAAFEFLQHQRVGFPDRLAGQFADRQRRRIAEETAVVADRVIHRQAVFLADVVVVHAVRRRGMHQAGAGFGRDVRAADDGHVAVLERVLEQDLVELVAAAGSDCRAFQAIALEAGFGQFAHQDQRALFGFDQVVGQFRMHADRLVGRQRPRGRRPDHREGRAAQVGQTEGGGQLFGVVLMHLEGDVDGRRGLVLVLDLGLGQRRTAVQTPVDRLQPLIEVALLQNPAQRTDFIGLGLEIHGQVGVVPLAQHAEADEILLLALDLLGGISTRQFAHLVGGNVLAVLLLDLVLDRQAVAVPARHVGRIEAGERLRADDDVLQHLVDRMADVDVAVGIRRAIVQHEARAAGADLADALIELFLLPLGDPLRFALGQVAAHREGGVGQVQGVFVISHCACSQREEGPRRHGIGRDLRLEGVEIGETLFVAQLVHETNGNMLAVDVAVEIEQVHLEQRPRATHGRPDAEVGDAGQRLVAQAADLDGENAGHRQRIVLDADVRGGETELAADLVAVRDLAVDDVRPAEQARRMFHLARRQCGANARTGHSFAVDRDTAHRLDGKAVLGAGACNNVKSPARPLPKRKSSPMIRWRTRSPRTSTRSMNWSADSAANAALKRHTMACSTPASASNSIFSRKVVNRAGAEAGLKNSRGCGSKVRMVGGSENSRATSPRRPNKAPCPRCTPSKLPMATAVGPGTGREKPRKIRI